MPLPWQKAAPVAGVLLFGSLLPVVAVAPPAEAVPATVIVNETFTGSSIPDPLIRGNGSTCLTGAAQASPPPAGQSSIGGCPAGLRGPIPTLGTVPGYLLLTDASNNKAGDVFYNRPVPADSGLEATFEIYEYGGSGADGITFYLVDGATELTDTGGRGGSLGYAQRFTNEDGILGGYVGVGFDVYGNYYDDGENRGAGCPPGQRSPSSASGPIAPNTVVVRGPGSGLSGYCYQASTTDPASNPNKPTSTLPGQLGGTTLTNAKRTVNVVISPAPNPTITVRVDFNDGRGFLQVLSTPAPPNPPTTYKFGFSGSTGGSTDVHLLRNVVVGTVNALGTLNLEKQVDRSGPALPAVITEGTVIPYQFVVTNAGTTTLTNPVINDPKVTNATCPQVSMPPTPAANSTIVCTGSYTVTAADVTAGRVVNAATATAGGVTSNQATVTVPLTSALTLSKAVTTAGPYSVGQTVAYSYTVRNTGGSTISNLAVTDNRVAKVSCEVTVLAPAAAVTCSGSYVVRSQDLDASGQLTNTATVAGTTPIGQVVQSPPAAVTIPVAADIALTKTVNNPNPVVGQNVTYTITVTNLGPGDARNVVVNDPIPFGTTNVSVTTSTGTYSSATGNWTIPVLNVGQSATLVETDTVNSGAAVVNGATVTGADQPDPNPSNNSGSVTVNPTVPSTDIAVLKTIEPAIIRVGQTAIATVTVNNAGPFPATGVTVRDPLPIGIEFVSATGDGSVDPATGIWTVGDLPFPGSASIQIVVRATATGFVLNTASLVTVSPEDVNHTNDVATASLQVDPPLADLGVGKVVRPSDNATVGDAVSYVVSATNDGPDSAPAVVVTDFFPAGLALQSSNAERGTYDSATGIWTVGALGAGETVRLELFTTATAPGLQSNSVSITDSSVEDPNGANNAATAVINVAPVPPPPVDVGLTKTANVTQVTPGRTVTFTVTASNNGPNAATNVAFTDLLPPGLDLVSATASAGTFDQPTGRWTLPTLAVGATPTLTFVTTATGGPGTYTNAIGLTGLDQTDTNDQNNAASASVQIAPEADLSVTKTVSPAVAQVGDIVTYTVVVTNNGPDTDTRIQLVETNRTPATFISVNPSQGTFDPTTRVWTVGDLASGASATILVQVQLVRGGTIVNRTVVFTADLPDPDLTNNEATATLIAPNADLAVTKSVSNASPGTGEQVTFTIGVTNAGPDEALGVTVTDAFPAGLDLLSATPSVGSFDGATRVWTVGAMLPGSSQTLTVDAVAPSGGTFVNTATGAAVSPADSNPGNNTASATVTYPDVPPPTTPPTTPPSTPPTTAAPPGGGADLRLTKTVTPQTVVINSTVTYTLTVANQGPAGAEAVVLTDAIPAGITPLTADNGCTISGQSVTCAIGALAVGGLFTVHVTARVDGTGTLTNIATVQSATADPTPADARAEASVRSGAGLPPTGSDAMLLLLLAFCVLAAGASLAVVVWRRRHLAPE